MKKIIVLGISSFLAFSTFNIRASESILENEVDSSEAEQITSGMFDELDESEQVLELPDGGFLHGKAELYDGNKLIAIYDSDVDSQAITIKNARKRIARQIEKGATNNKITTVGIPTKRYLLSYGSSYQSKPFSGSGWRFSGYQFAIPGPGFPADEYYLRWSTHGDSGRVGNHVEAINTLNSKVGKLYGNPIYEGNSYWFTYGALGQIYFTYNPNPGTYYYVKNIDL